MSDAEHYGRRMDAEILARREAEAEATRWRLAARNVGMHRGLSATTAVEVAQREYDALRSEAA